MNNRKRILIDCDPGHDDMMAIMLASASEEVELAGVTTVAGNQTGDKTFRNACQVLTLIREDAPVARGSDKPLVRELLTAPQFHGQTGLDGADLPPVGISPLDVHAADFIIMTLEQSREKMILVPTGPLTNIALALIKAPRIKEKVERIVLMGGGMHDSNVTPAAEYNIYVDPEAAKVVFESGVPITMVGLDVTNRAIMTLEDIEALTVPGGKVSDVVVPLLRFFARANKDIFGLPGAPLHDALAVAAVIEPGIVETKHLHVAVETAGVLTRGMTLVDFYGVTKQKPNVDVALELDARRFVSMMTAAIDKLNRKLG